MKERIKEKENERKNKRKRKKEKKSHKLNAVTGCHFADCVKHAGQLFRRRNERRRVVGVGIVHFVVNVGVGIVIAVLIANRCVSHCCWRTDQKARDH